MSHLQPTPFAINVLSTGGRTVRVQVEGELDVSTAPQLGESLQHEIGEGHDVVLDLSKIAFIDSTGLNTILSAMKTSDSTGGRFAISKSLPAQARRVMEITGVERMLAVDAD